MTTIYLIRHAEAEGNLYRIAQGQCNSIITDRGYQQISALAKRFESIPVDAVYSSDLMRTCITAGAIWVPKHLPLNKRKDLREICVGRWEEQTWGEIFLTDQEQLTLFTKRPDLWQIEGAESMAAVRDRMLSAIQEIGAANGGKTVAVFSHGCALRLLLGTLQGCTLETMGDTPHGDNTAVSLVEYDQGKLRVVFRDDASHLKGLSASVRENSKKRSTAVEPGLYFRPAQFPEQEELLADWVGAYWASINEGRPFHRETLMREAAGRPTLVAYLGDTPAGVLQLNPGKEEREKKGWLALYCMAPALRARGLGIQLLGQAVLRYRALNREALRLALPIGDNAIKFFEQYGFRSVGQTRDGRNILEKDIRYREWQAEPRSV